MKAEIKRHLDNIKNELHELSKNLHTADEWAAFNAMELSLHGLLSAFEYEIDNNTEN